MGWTAADYDPELARIRSWLKVYSPSTKDIWLTEYFRYSDIDRQRIRARNLIVALGNADFIMQNLMAHDLTSAQHFGFNCGGTGTVFPGNNKVYHGQKIPEGLVVRFPVHWVFALFGASTFHDAGGLILNPVTQCSQYQVMGHSIPVLRAVAAMNQDNSKVDILLLNKNLEAAVNVTIQLTAPGKKVAAVKATEFNSKKTDSNYPLFDENDLVTQNVHVEKMPSPLVEGETIQGALAPHSLTLYSCELR